MERHRRGHNGFQVGEPEAGGETMKRNQRGFTLMELMVVIVIVAILAAVAVPLYINYVKDVKRSEAKGAIAALISAEQVAYQKTCPACTYADGGDGTNGTIDVAAIVDEAGQNWTFEIANVAPGVDGSFTINATGKNAADGLQVQCVYTHGQAPQWSDVIQ